MKRNGSIRWAAAACCLLLAAWYSAPAAAPAAARDEEPKWSRLDSSLVRVKASGLPRRVTGTLNFVGQDSLYLAGTQSTLAIPLSTVSSLEVSRGRHARTLRGLWIGTLTGAVIGAALFAGDNSGALAGYTTAEKAKIGATEWGILGALVGTIVGALSHTEAWERVPIDRLERPEPDAPTALAPDPESPPMRR
ncbi:MAG TPA: hypothetical protein VFS09_03335 [Candidatus Eisenbacteria bacterium]|nr:hypothetical protein [Candidatus Eisenbacteria bacterium]